MIPITAVTVHPDGALVRRAGVLPIVDGAITVRRLPLLLEPASLRVAVVGAAVREVTLQLDTDGVDRPGEPEAVAALREVEAERGRLREELIALHRAREAAAAIAPAFHRRSAPPTADHLQAWATLDAVVAPWAAELDEAARAAQGALEAATARLRILQTAIEESSDEAMWRRWVPTWVALVGVDGDGEAEVGLSYRVPGATWTPSYVLDAAADLATGRFSMRARVVQATGEDWPDVAVRLATAPSRRVLDVPVLPALRLGTKQPPAPPAWRPLPDDLEGLFPPDVGPQLRTMAASPEAVSAPAVAMMSAAAPPAPRRAKKRMRGAPSPPAPPAADAALDVAADWLDYGSLRLGSWDATPGARGRLQRVSDAERLGERGLPDVAHQRVRAALRMAEDAARAVSSRPAAIGGGDHRFAADGVATLPSDGRVHSVAVFAQDASLSVSYRAVPRHDARVFRRVAAQIGHAGALLPGPVEVQVGGALERTVAWSGSRGRGALQLNLGTEDRLELVRNVRYAEEKAGMLGGSRRLRTTIEVSIASHMGRAVAVEVLERVPVADGDAPGVEVTEASPVAREWTGDPEGPALRGGRVQVIEVAAGSQARAVLGYSVTLGAKDTLAGGERRG